MRWARRGCAAAIVAVGLGWALALGAAAGRCRLESPPATVQLRDRHGEFLGEVGSDQGLGYWPVDVLPERVVAATLAMEDRRFAVHPGVDLRAIGRALDQSRRAGRWVSGASTIAMQVARMQDRGPRTVGRKGLEALTALLLVDRYGREEVLRHYLRLAPYGNNVHGIGYAARRYFDKPVDDLSWAETALLAAVPQAPVQRDLYTPAGRDLAVRRAVVILDRLLADGALGPLDHEVAVRELRTLRPSYRPIRPATTLHPVLALERDVAAHRERYPDPIVETSLDLELQGKVQWTLHDAVAAWEDRGAGNAAAVVIDLDTRQVLVDVGSTGWNDREHKGAIDYSRAQRYPGSTLKPFLYAHAIDRGLVGPGTVLDDLERGPDGIGNADGRFLGPMLPRAALANSRNVPAIALTRRIGLDASWSLLARLGLHDDRLPAQHYGLGVAIGGMPTTPLALARAWAALASDGTLRELQWRSDARAAAGPAVFSPEVAAWTALALSDPLARLPTFPRMGASELPFPAAFKTGTSPDHRDAWAVAYTRKYLVVTWVGHPDWRPMEGLSGYRAGARLARAILLALHPDQAAGFSDTGFPPPAGWSSRRVCSLTGHLAGEACTGSTVEWFPPSGEPQTPCAAHRLEGERRVVDLPPRYAAWAASEQLPTPALADPGDHVALDVSSPVDGARVEADPEAPPGQSTLRLSVAVDPPVEQVVWFVDGQPYKVVSPPYEVRWPLEPGEHVFEARLPYRPERSSPVRVTAL
ncbi:MAG: transglycosylase domain-containing protein [Myxococcota bacterium]